MKKRIGIICFIFIVFLVFLGGKLMSKNIQIRLDEEPIYNHFPTLPKAKQLQWCSKSSSGIGLTTVKVYLYAFYIENIEMYFFDEIDNVIVDVEISPYFTPESLKGKDIKWKVIEDAEFFFQEGIPDHQKMGTKVYYSEQFNVIYIEAIG